MSRHRSFGALVSTMLHRRVLRFALVGGLGIPVNVGLLWLFHAGMRLPITGAWLLAFECSALLNFYANQRFTYHEQAHVRGMEWVRRALRAQLSSISGVLVNVAVYGILLTAGMHYLEADVSGIVAAFSVNFALANRFVFTPAIATSAPSFSELANALLYDVAEQSSTNQTAVGVDARCFAGTPVIGSDETAPARLAPAGLSVSSDIAVHSRSA